VDIHQHLRNELTQIRDLVAQVLDGTLGPGAARSLVNEMTIRQNNWTVGAYCASYCRLVTMHHTIEDQAMFPRLRQADPRLTPVVDRLHAEHEVIAEVLEGVDRALLALVGTNPDGGGLTLAVDQLSDALLSHLAYEERELVEPLARLSILV
jgi:hemerythrin superfamily protein